jgi:hypothetical protein
MFRLWGVVCLTCACLCAQSNFATLSGRIQDPSQAPVSGARVTVKAKATEAVRQSATNDQGIFETPNLLPGEYSVEVAKQGFAVETRKVVLEVGQHMGLDFSLQLGEQHQAVSVVSAAEVLKTQDVSLGEVVEPRSIDNLPLNGRQLIDLA